MKTKCGAAPFALSSLVIVIASAVGAVVLLMIAVRTYGGPEARIRYTVLEVGSVEAVMMGFVQEAVVGNRWQSTVSGGNRMSINVRRRRLFVDVADFADRAVRRRASGWKRRHHSRMMVPVKRREAERVRQPDGTVSLMMWQRWRWRLSVDV